MCKCAEEALKKIGLQKHALVENSFTGRGKLPDKLTPDISMSISSHTQN